MNELVPNEFLAEKTAAITSLVGSVRRDIAEIGRHLSEVKERFGRGDNPKFLAWASEAFGWSPATIYRYIEIFEFMRTGNFLNLRKLDLDLSSLYLLIAPSTTDEARAEVVKQAKTKKLAHADVKKTVARHAKPKAKKTAPAAKPRQPDPAPLVEVVEDSECKLEIGDGETIPYDEAVREGKLLVEQLKAETPEEFEEPQYMTVEPDAAPPLVHVDPPAPGDFMVGHLREELGARDEEIDDLKSSVAGFITIVKEKEQEIVELQVRVENLMDRQRQQILFVGDILDEMRSAPRYHGNNKSYMIKFREGLEAQPSTIKLTKKEVVMILERRASFDGGAAVSFDNGSDYHDDLPEVTDEPEAEEPAPPAKSAAQTWDQFVAIYRATETPLPENHPKLIAGMVHGPTRTVSMSSNLSARRKRRWRFGQ